jgi:peroxiredoxin
MKARVASIVLVSLVLLAGMRPSLATDTAMRIRIGEKAPVFSLQELMTGKTVTLSEYKGRNVVMVEFWGTWCDICVREVPELRKLYSEWKDRGFELLSIAVPPGDADEVRRFVREKKLPYPTFLDEDLTVAAGLYGLAGPIPLKVLVDHRGVVRYAHVGDYPPGDGELSQMIEDLVKEMDEGNGRTASRSR